MRYSIRTLLIITTAIALFLAGYCLGVHHGRRGRSDFDRFIELIETTIKPESWKNNGSDEENADPFSTTLKID